MYFGPKECNLSWRIASFLAYAESWRHYRVEKKICCRDSWDRMEDFRVEKCMECMHEHHDSWRLDEGLPTREDLYSISTREDTLKHCRVEKLTLVSRLVRMHGRLPTHEASSSISTRECAWEIADSWRCEGVCRVVKMCIQVADSWSYRVTPSHGSFNCFDF